jgi:hypothetical protein
LGEPFEIRTDCNRSLHDADRRAVDVERDVKPVEKIIPIFEIAGHHLKKGAVHQRSDQ